MGESPREQLDPEVVADVRALFAMRKKAEEEEPQTLNERVDVTLEGVGNGPFRVKKRDFSFYVDEPAQRAGTDQAPNPLAFFLSGAATCYLSHFMLISIRDELPVDALRMTARAHFDRRLLGGIMKDVIYDLKLESSAGGEAIEAVAREAEKACYAHNTLVAAGVELTTNVFLNSEKVCSFQADVSHL